MTNKTPTLYTTPTVLLSIYALSLPYECTVVAVSYYHMTDMCRDINHTLSHWSACSYWLQCHLSDDFLSQALRYSNEERLKENIHTNMCDGWICFPIVNQYPQVFFSKESLIHREHGVIKGHLNTEVQSLRLKGKRFWPSTFDPRPVVKQQQRCKHTLLCWVFILSSNAICPW